MVANASIRADVAKKSRAHVNAADLRFLLILFLLPFVLVGEGRQENKRAVPVPHGHGIELERKALLAILELPRVAKGDPVPATVWIRRTHHE